MLTARLFGGLRVWIDERPLPPLPGLRPRALLAQLLLDPTPQPRARLAGRFWPDVLDTSARASLRSALWTVREALDAVGGSAYLDAGRAHVGIAGDLPRDVDTERFADLAARRDDPAALEEAVALAAGPLLADLADEWVLDAQDAHRAALVDVLRRLARLAEDAGDLPAAVRWTRAVVAEERFDEGAHRDLMRLLDACGERAQALDGYDRLRRLLASDLGIVPSPATRELARALRGDGPPAPAAPAPAPASRRPPPPRSAPVGRRHERAVLRGAWEAAASGAGGLAVVAGHGGIGKSCLVDDLAAAARAEGALVARGDALDIEGAPPLAPWSEAVRTLVEAVPAPDGAAWPGDLARLSPAVATAWGRPPGDAAPAPGLERILVFEAVAELVAWAARRAPVLLVLEDLHTADPATCALLAHVARRLAGVPALIVATRRPAPDAGGLDAAVDAVRPRLRVDDVALGPLDPEATAAVVAGHAPGLAADAVDRVARAAGGNPLLAREAARAAAAGRDPAEGLRAAVRRPLARLAPSSRPLVDAVAAAGRALPAEEAGRVAPGGLGEALADAQAQGLLVRDDDGRVRFAHDLLRDACYAEIGDARRAAAHRRLAAALGAHSGRRAGEVARHHLRGGDPETARRYLAEAARDARALGALDEAAAYLTEAAAMAGGDAVGRAELWLALAEVHAWRADRPAMDAAFARAEARLSEAGDARGLAYAHASRGRWLHTTLCHPAEALAASRRALAVIDGGRLPVPEVRLLALTGAAWAEAVAGDPAEAARLADAARAMPEADGDVALEAELEHARGTALLRAGDAVAAGEVCERAASLAHAAGRADMAALCLLTASTAAACAGQVERVLALADRLDGWAWPGVGLQAQMAAARAHALARLGRHGEAVAAAREAVAAADRAGDAINRPLAALDLGLVLLESGDPDAAAASLREALDAPAAPVPRALARLRLAEALVRAGDPAAARTALDEVPFEPARAADMVESLVPRIAHVRALLAAGGGDATEAARRLDEAEAGWRRLAASPRAGEAVAAVLVDLGRPPVAGLVDPVHELARVAADRAPTPVAGSV
ncbi:ATP-binding protein [Miltoncostaea oceani]|uniref:ATP-binding protein n=1 Tax=Miltoncostaea oceani TaxID=2843216 RepID=UPI001C3DC869|nr:AAA family ATPase [Miltoncostaea oceani]